MSRRQSIPHGAMGPGANGNHLAAIYLRRSTDRQEKSLDDQRHEILRYAGERGYSVVAEFVDGRCQRHFRRSTQGLSRHARTGAIAGARLADRPGLGHQAVRAHGERRGRVLPLALQAGRGRDRLHLRRVHGGSADKFLRFFKQERRATSRRPSPKPSSADSFP